MTLREELNYLLHEKAGEISMCWSNIDKAGTFDSSKAISIVEEALTAILKLYSNHITLKEAYEECCDSLDLPIAVQPYGEERYKTWKALRTAFKIPEGKE